MFESMVHAPEIDLLWASKLRSYLKIYFYVAFICQTCTFSLIFYLIHFRAPSKMLEYRRLLQVNIISAYLTELSFILWIPVVLPTNYHAISDGLIGVFGPKVQYYWIILISCFAFSHFIAISGCVLFQVYIIYFLNSHLIQISKISTFKSNFIHAISNFTLGSKFRFYLIYIGFSALVSIAFTCYTLFNVKVDFQPAKSLNLLIPQDKLVYERYLQNSTNAIFIDVSQTGYLLIIFTIVMVRLKWADFKVCLK